MITYQIYQMVHKIWYDDISDGTQNMQKLVCDLILLLSYAIICYNIHPPFIETKLLQSYSV